MNRVLLRPFVISKRFASQEINPILYRLERTKDTVPFDRSAHRSWTHHCYAPHVGYGMHFHYAPFAIQGLRLKQYLDGYFTGKALIGQPLIYRTVAGNVVRLFIYNPANVKFDWKEMEETLSRVFGMYQGPGTSGRSADDNQVQGRVKTRLDVINIESPMLNADILAQYVGGLLKQNKSAAMIFDKLAALIDDGIPKRSPVTGLSSLPVAGFRVRIKGRPRGEEMAVKHDVLKGSCPKKDQDAWMDYGKCDVLLRSGKVGVKAWVHFQKPHRQDETGKIQTLHYLGGENLVDEEEVDDDASLEGRSTDAPELSVSSQEYPFPSLLLPDQDYDPDVVEKDYQRRMQVQKRNEKGEIVSKGLWNVDCSQDPEVKSLVAMLKDLHTPDLPEHSRFIW